MTLENRTVRLGEASRHLTLSFDPGQVTASFQSRGLSGVWVIETNDLWNAMGRELEALHASLLGKVMFGDDESLGVTFQIGSRGQATADIHIEGWPFGINGTIGFSTDVDHAELLRLARILAGQRK